MASARMVHKVTARLWPSVGHLRRRAPLSAALLRQVQRKPTLLGNQPSLFYSSLPPPSEVSLKYKYDRLVLEVPLPSRNEKCVFFLRPMLMSVGDLIADLQREDPGVTASLLSKDGQRVDRATLVDALLDKDFRLVLNDAVYEVKAPERAAASSEQVAQLRDMKHVVHLLHTALHMPEHHLLKERELLEKMDALKQELSPLEQLRAQLSRTAELQTSKFVWSGMALLSVQGGALAWLTWWVYSWDVMEPVTYFITYATSIGVFSYYVLTKQDYVYPEVQDRQFLRYFYKGASRKRFSVERYNALKEELAQVEEDLRRLKYPTQLQMPLEQIQPKP